MAGFSKYNRGPGDSILALLEPGEYVLNRNAVEEVGKDNLDDLNYEDAPRFDMSQRGQFQVGGMLGDMVGYQTGDYVDYKAKIEGLGDKYKGLQSEGVYTKEGDWSLESILKDTGYPLEGTQVDTLMGGRPGGSLMLGLEHPDRPGRTQWSRSGANKGKMDFDMRWERAELFDKWNEADKKKGLTLSDSPAFRYKMGKSKEESRKKEDSERILMNKMLLEKGYSQEEIDAYNAFKGRYQLGGILGMQGGGSTLEYGGATTEEPTLEELYKRMGMQPNVTRRPGFEEQWAYDPSREGTWFEDYGMDIQGATQAGRQNLMGAGQKMQQTQAKAGFAGSGAGAQAVSQQRGTIMQDFLAKEAAAKSSLFKGVRGEREKWMTEAGGALGTLQGAEGTVDYGAGGTPDWAEVPADDPNWNPPSNPTGGQVYNMDGANYYWNQNTNSWETEQDYNYSTQDRDDDDEWGPSDVRLKKDINYLFTMNNGVPIYTFKYKWSDDVSIGTMAQDIEDMIPEAVSTHSSGYKMVNYSKVFSYGKI
jgi:hypothetical protein